MNARELLEDYGELREKAGARGREATACKKQLARAIAQESANEAHLKKRLHRLSAEQKSLQRRMTQRQKQIEHLLSSLKMETLGQVLALRYLSLLSYEQIGQSLHFSSRHVQRLHVLGVAELQKLLEK